MTLYFAPLEGLTGEVYRQAHAALCPPADQYMTPFYSPTATGLTKRDAASLALCAGDGVTVPQLLTKNASDFLAAAAQLAAMGYREVNLNLGCPSGTVTAKGKGAGFLAHPNELHAFLEEVFDRAASRLPGMTVTVKTRLGYLSEDGIPALLSMFNEYPFGEWILHPRLRCDFYRGTPRMAAFRYVAENSRAPVCYNGDLFRASDVRNFSKEYPAISRVMLGRGAVANPLLFGVCRGALPHDPRAVVRAFHDAVLEENLRRMGEGRNFLCRMADIWNYQIFLFRDATAAQRRIRAARNLAEYRAAVATLFREYEFLPDGAYVPPVAAE